MKKLFFLSCLAILLSIYIIPANRQALAGEKIDQPAARAVAGVFIPGQFNEPDYFIYKLRGKGWGYMSVNKDGLSAKIDFSAPTEKAIAAFNKISKQLGFPYLVEYNCLDGTLFLEPR